MDMPALQRDRSRHASQPFMFHEGIETGATMTEPPPTAVYMYRCVRAAGVPWRLQLMLACPTRALECERGPTIIVRFEVSLNDPIGDNVLEERS